MKEERLPLALRAIGLSQKEAAIYLAALRLGESSLTEINQEARLKWTITHNLTQGLVLRGFLSEISKGKRKAYSAVHPRRILQVAELNRNQVEELMPELTALHYGQTKKPRAQLYEGIEGVRRAYEEILEGINDKKEVLWMSDIESVEREFPKVLTEYIQAIYGLNRPVARELIQKNNTGEKYIASLSEKKIISTEARFLPSGLIVTNADQAIIGDRLYQFVLEENIFVSILESDTIVTTQRSVFEYLWGVSQEK
jgi:sugar-specific transcriptional regulator TrmB